MEIRLIGTRDGVLGFAAETLEELGIVWSWGQTSAAGEIAIVEGLGDGGSGVVIRVPTGETPESALDALKAAASMAGATMAVGKAGAINAALFSARVIALDDAGVRERLEAWTTARRDAVLAKPDPREG